MKRALNFAIIILFFVGLVSSSMIFTNEPEEIYNSGDSLQLKLKISAETPLEDFLNGQLICDGKINEIYKEFILLNPGEEKTITPTIPLTISTVGKNYGQCIIKFSLPEQYILTQEFKISNLLKLELKEIKEEYAPSDTLNIEGNAFKENGNPSKGKVTIKLIEEGNARIEKADILTNGYFNVELKLPEDLAAGKYLLSVEVTEQEKEEVSNRGFLNQNLQISQIPTSLEISAEEKEIKPGNPIKISAILRDQTGEKIESNAKIEIKGEDNKILFETETTTDTQIKYPTLYNEPKKTLIVKAYSDKFESQLKIQIIENAEIKTELVNETLIVTNTGNIPYNDIVFAKIGETEIEFNTALNVDETKKYILSAPQGKYNVEINNGRATITGEAILTGKTISIKEAKEGALRYISHPFAWIFMMFIMGFVAFMVFKKGYKKSFIGYISRRKRDNSPKEIPVPKKENFLKINSPAIVSLSIKGTKQEASSLTLNIKNLEEIQKSKDNRKETLQKIIHLAESKKVATYENQNCLIFLFSPAKTKTFRNEKPTVTLAQEIKKELDAHNAIMQNKIEYGINLNLGRIISKNQAEGLLFTSLGTFITSGKKISALSKREITLSDSFRQKVIKDAKTEKITFQDTDYYILKEMKIENSDNKKFINSFVERMKKEEKRPNSPESNNSE
jgi:hypothetical protein